MSLVIGEQVRKNSIAATILHRRHLHIVCLFTIYTYIHHPQKVFIQPLFYLFHKLQNCVIGGGWVLLLLRKDAFYYALETKYSDFQQKKISLWVLHNLWEKSFWRKCTCVFYNCNTNNTSRAVVEYYVHSTMHSISILE